MDPPLYHVATLSNLSHPDWRNFRVVDFYDSGVAMTPCARAMAPILCANSPTAKQYAYKLMRKQAVHAYDTSSIEIKHE